MQLEAIKNTLLTRRRELEPRVSREDIAIERVTESIDIVQHAADRDLAISSLSMNWRALREVDAALARITDGSFGGVCALRRGHCRTASARHPLGRLLHPMPGGSRSRTADYRGSDVFYG